MKARCYYCGSLSNDDNRGNCSCCGAPREQTGIFNYSLNINTTEELYKDASVGRFNDYIVKWDGCSWSSLGQDKDGNIYVGGDFGGR